MKPDCLSKRVVIDGMALSTAAIIFHLAKKPMKPKPKTRNFNKLTPIQKQVLRGWCDSLTYAQIASRLSVSVDTVRDHQRALFTKLNARTRAQAVFHFMLHQGYRPFRRV